MHRLGFLAVIVALTINGPVLGQSADEPVSRLNAYECENLPKPLRVTVQVLDNDDRFLKFKDHFEKALRRGGAEIAADAPVIVTLDVRIVRELQKNPTGALFELRAGQENENIGHEGTVFFRGNVWSNRTDSMLGGPKPLSRRLALNQLQVTANINRGADGRCLWQGEVLHDLSGENSDDATLRIIDILARHLGKSVRNRTLIIEP